jgi:hypothetical protein
MVIFPTPNLDYPSKLLRVCKKSVKEVKERGTFCDLRGLVRGHLRFLGGIRLLFASLHSITEFLHLSIGKRGFQHGFVRSLPNFGTYNAGGGPLFSFYLLSEVTFGRGQWGAILGRIEIRFELFPPGSRFLPSLLGGFLDFSET